MTEQTYAHAFKAIEIRYREMTAHRAPDDALHDATLELLEHAVAGTLTESMVPALPARAKARRLSAFRRSHESEERATEQADGETAADWIRALYRTPVDNAERLEKVSGLSSRKAAEALGLPTTRAAAICKYRAIEKGKKENGNAACTKAE